MRGEGWRVWGGGCEEWRVWDGGCEEWTVGGVRSGGWGVQCDVWFVGMNFSPKPQSLYK